MKIQRVIVSTDNNKYYVNFWPLIAYSWTKNTNFVPTLFFIGNKSDFKFKEIKQTEVYFVKPLDNISPGKYARSIRVLAPLLFPKDVCITTDIDILPLNLNYFRAVIKKYDNTKLISLTSDAYPKQPWRLPLCYYCGLGKTFASVLGIDITINRSYEEYVQLFNTVLTHWYSLKFSNTTDEYIFSVLLRLWKNKENLVKIPRVTNPKGTRMVSRVETRLELNKKRNPEGINLKKLKSGKYIDVSLCKPFRCNYNILKPVLDYIGYKINPKNIPDYGKSFIDKHVYHIKRHPKLSLITPMIIKVQKEILDIINMNNYAIIIQARTSSTRLPNKILKPFFKDETILRIMIDKLKRCNVPLIVATTTNIKDDIICSVCDEMKVNYHRGSEENVLERFIRTAQHYKINFIIRVCSDNPFIDENIITSLINEYTTLVDKPDYYSYTLDGSKPIIREHIGTFSELVTLKTLLEVNEKNDKKLYQEHVTNYIYDNRKKFNIVLKAVPLYISNSDLKHDIRLTVDTATDFGLLSVLYFEIRNKYGINFTLENTIGYLLENEDRFISKMRKLILNNLK